MSTTQVDISVTTSGCLFIVVGNNMNIIPSRIAYTMDTTIYLSNTFLLYFNINNGINCVSY